VKDGRLQALAVGSPKRTAIFPDLPTTVEAGYPNSDYTFWIGALVSSKTPRDIVQRLNREFTTALKFLDVQERMKNLGVDPLNLSIEEFEAMVKKELAENVELVKRAGIKPN
jgi:tripartite-type tricarboxylate transporter receptor subunit TctC